MGQHNYPGLSLGAAYVRRQRIGPVTPLIVSSPDLRMKNSMVRKMPNGDRILVEAPRTDGIQKKIRASIVKRLKVGLGRAERIERKHGGR